MTELAVLPVADPIAELPLGTEAPERISLGVRVANLIAVIVPFLGLVAAVVLLWGWGFHWIDLGLLGGMYVLTVLGITVCHLWGRQPFRSTTKAGTTLSSASWA